MPFSPPCFACSAATSVLTCAVYNRPELGSALGKSLGKVKSLLGGSSVSGMFCFG